MADEALNLAVEWQVLWNRKFYLGLTILLAGLVAYVATLPVFYPPEYLAKASFVPPVLAEMQVALANRRSETPMDKDLEQMTGALTSDSTENYMAAKFGLIDHYGVREGNLRRQFKHLHEAFQDKISINLTRYSTIEINVYDTDPQLAARIANTYLACADSFAETVTKRKNGAAALHATLVGLERRSHEVQDTLGKLRSAYPIFDLHQLSEAGAVVVLRSMQNNPGFAAHYDKVISLEKELEFLDKSLVEVRSDYLLMQQNLHTYPTLINVVGYAVPPHFPLRPNRLLTVLGAMLAAAVLSGLTVLWVDPQNKPTIN